MVLWRCGFTTPCHTVAILPTTVAPTSTITNRPTAPSNTHTTRSLRANNPVTPGAVIGFFAKIGRRVHAANSSPPRIGRKSMRRSAQSSNCICSVNGATISNRSSGFSGRLAGGQQLQHINDADAHAANARTAPTLLGIDCDALKERDGVRDAAHQGIRSEADSGSGGKIGYRPAHRLVRRRPGRLSVTAKAAPTVPYPTRSQWPYNAGANLRASQTKRERSELPNIARQVQRSLAQRGPRNSSQQRLRLQISDGAPYPFQRTVSVPREPPGAECEIHCEQRRREQRCKLRPNL